MPGSKNALGIWPILLLAGLLALPACALARVAPRIDWKFLGGAPVLLSLAAWFVCRADKRRAEAGEWRIPESTLHLTEVLGGWPGAFLAQRFFRHKISKGSYQFTFWAIILVYQCVALDSLLGWTMSKYAAQFIASHW